MRMRWFLCAAAISLLARSVAGQGSFTDVNGVRLYHDVQGNGPALVLIHGWAVNSDYWDDQVPALRDKFRVIRYDRRGFGKSGGVPDFSADPSDLDQLLGKLGVESAYVLGHSQGALVAQGFAVSYPRRVKALIVFGSAPVPGFSLPWSGPDALNFPEIVRAARTYGVDSIWKFMEKAPLFTQDALSAEQAARMERIKKAYRGADLITEVPPARPKEIATIERLREITAPTLVLTGDREAPYFLVMADAIAYAIPNAKRLVLNGGGHLINLSRPAAFNAAVINYLTTLDQPK